MGVFKRGHVYWYHFWFNGEHIQESTKQGNPRVARQMEAAHRTALAKGEVGIIEHKPAPTLKEFSQCFVDYLHVRDGKSKFARRNVPLTGRVRAMLVTRKAVAQSSWVFAESDAQPMLGTSMDHLHMECRRTLKMPPEFVLHSLRHTYGTRLGEAGADAFTIMRLMGHSSVTVSQRYVHPTPEALERAVERLEGLNQKALAALPGSPNPQLPATVFATVESGRSVSP